MALQSGSFLSLTARNGSFWYVKPMNKVTSEKTGTIQKNPSVKDETNSQPTGRNNVLNIELDYQARMNRIFIEER